VTTVVGYSQVELRKQPVDAFDIIYIDGSHTADDVLEDAVLSWRQLKPGGLLIFDDYQADGWNHELPRKTPRVAIHAFYLLYGVHFEVLHNGYQIILHKKEAPASASL
jgi:predicted O-methyltransferase YrrM